ncbi:CU044_5270 family protein [Actinomadura roseirufa]|uniref:CU044_5270 family protein n=1 Tax=Actinomadura roseirufa TaxID=2094049 RepID=UPI00104140DA|nr:CU044_5270 family protein [Actinomadura roseirufa]
MNELDIVGTVRSEIGEPSPDRLARGRARLLEGLAEPAPARRRFARPVIVRRTALAGGLAVAMAAGLMVLQTGDDGANPVLPRSEAAADVLNRAALAADKSPALRVPRGKYLYVEQLIKVGSPDGPFRTDRVQSWGGPEAMAKMQQTRKAPHIFKQGQEPPGFKLHGGPGFSAGTPYQPQKTLDALPTDPDRLLDKARHPGLGADGHTTEATPEEVRAFLAAWLQMPTLPSKVRSAAYRALAKLPGVTLDRDAVDASGRHGVGIGLGAISRPDGQFTLILDRNDYRLLGTREISKIFQEDDKTKRRINEETALSITATVKTAAASQYRVVP